MVLMIIERVKYSVTIRAANIHVGINNTGFGRRKLPEGR
jgi:hypothetical protein